MICGLFISKLLSVHNDKNCVDLTKKGQSVICLSKIVGTYSRFPSIRRSAERFSSKRQENNRFAI